MFTLQIENTAPRFRVTVLTNTAPPVKVADFGWHGGYFEWENEKYCVYGPYHSLDREQFRVYKLVPVSEVA